MKKRVLLSAMLAGVLLLSGCESKDPITATPGTDTPTPDTPTPSADVVKVTDGKGNTVATVDPTKGGTVIINRNNSAGTNNVANIVKAELKKCAEVDTSLVNTPGIACSPKEGVTYIFGTDYGRLGPVDNDKDTPDGGVLLKYAFTEFGGKKSPTPVEGNASENRIQEVFIPTNYIRLNDAAIAANLSVDDKYELIKKELEDVCNMKCQSGENSNNPFFGVNDVSGDDSNVTTGKFIATYVMHFTRGVGEKKLLADYENNNWENLEYLTVSFELDVTKAGKIDDNGTMRDILRYTSREGTPVVFGAKKHDSAGGGLTVVTTNINMNEVANLTNVTDSDNTWTINMAKYFNKLIAKGEAVGVADYAKAILVENATNPWPVKIYGTLHEVTETNGVYANKDSYKRSYVRNPSNFDPGLFGLMQAGPYQDIYSGKADNQAIKFNIVYPGGVYNKLD